MHIGMQSSLTHVWVHMSLRRYRAPGLTKCRRARRRRRASGMPAHVDATCNERARHSKAERLKRPIGPIRRQSPIWSIPDEGARQNARAERDERVTAHADHANTADGRKEDARWPRARRAISSCTPSRRARNDEGLVRGQTVRSARVARIRAFDRRNSYLIRTATERE